MILLTRFELRKNSCEISYKNRKDIKEGCTLEQWEQEPSVIKTFSNKKAALNEVKNYETEITKLSGGSGTYYLVEEYYVEENVYNEEEEKKGNESFIACNGVWGLTKM